MTGYARERAHERIRELARSGLDVAAFLDEAGAALSKAVPNENHLGAPYWYTLDPESRLITSVYGGEGCELDTSEVMRWEYLDDDINKYAEVFAHPQRVQTLHEVSGGDPQQSRIYREYMTEAGIAQEMLVGLGDTSGTFWGTVRLNRLTGQPEFDDDDRRCMAALAPQLAEGIRRGLLVGEATDPDLPDAPGLLILDADGAIASCSPTAHDWLARLPGPLRQGGLPASLASAAAAAQACTVTSPSAETTVLVRSNDGLWISVHGTSIGVGMEAQAAIIIAAAHPERVSRLLMSLHGLTPREQDVTRLVLHGLPTEQLAQRLGITSQTVQQHLKSIFEKVGVRSRQALVGALFAAAFEPRVDDNDQRSRLGQAIRGGPLSRAG